MRGLGPDGRRRFEGDDPRDEATYQEEARCDGGAEGKRHGGD